MTDERKLMTSDQNCYEIQLTNKDCETFQIDNTSVLLEVRNDAGLYGVFYTAKGMQWDVWSDAAEEEERQDVAYAICDPVRAACELLGHQIRPDFKYDPEENEE